VARNVLGLEDADSAEASPNGSMLVIAPLLCSLAGTEQPVFPLPGTRAAELYGRVVTMPYLCNYGLEADWAVRLAEIGLRTTARGPEGEPRMVELAEHRFFVGTLFLPQLRSSPAAPDPLIQAFVETTWERAT